MNTKITSRRQRRPARSGSDTNETAVAVPATLEALARLPYRELARLQGCSTSTMWRHVNRGRRDTRTDIMHKERFALVCVYRYQRGWSIRRIAAELVISRSAVERDLRRARQLEAMGWSREEVVGRALADATPRAGNDGRRI